MKYNLQLERVQNWRNKSLHGEWPKVIEANSALSSHWLRKANLPPTIESQIIAAQDQALCTNWLKHHILHQATNDLCRLCKQHPETIHHIISGCPQLASTKYLERHNMVASAIHWSLCGQYSLDRPQEYWRHRPEAVCENTEFKLLYDFNIYTDKLIPARRPDIVLINKKKKETTIIDISCPRDTNTKDKEKEKVSKYLELKTELETIWKSKTTIVPIVIGALGAVSRDLEKHLKSLNITDIQLHELQKTVLINTIKIINSHLSHDAPGSC